MCVCVVVQNVQGASTNPRFFLYSGHDLGPVMPILSALNIWGGNWATYAAMINVELFDLPGQSQPRCHVVGLHLF